MNIDKYPDCKIKPEDSIKVLDEQKDIATVTESTINPTDAYVIEPTEMEDSTINTINDEEMYTALSESLLIHPTDKDVVETTSFESLVDPIESSGMEITQFEDQTLNPIESSGFEITSSEEFTKNLRGIDNTPSEFRKKKFP
uniref:Uncharacterized protein n=1 Tax=Acrobeloides nanus TaxID=290746 RepID=A0A914EIA2_9BILA